MTNRNSASRRYAAHMSWAYTADRTQRTAPARQAMFNKFLNEVDPGITDPVAREKAAESLRKAHYSKMAAKSVESRRLKSGAKRGILRDMREAPEPSAEPSPAPPVRKSVNRLSEPKKLPDGFRWETPPGADS